MLYFLTKKELVCLKKLKRSPWNKSHIKQLQEEGIMSTKVLLATGDQVLFGSCQSFCASVVYDEY